MLVMTPWMLYSTGLAPIVVPASLTVVAAWPFKRSLPPDDFLDFMHDATLAGTALASERIEQICARTQQRMQRREISVSEAEEILAAALWHGIDPDRQPAPDP